MTALYSPPDFGLGYLEAKVLEPFGGMKSGVFLSHGNFYAEKQPSNKVLLLALGVALIMPHHVHTLMYEPCWSSNPLFNGAPVAALTFSASRPTNQISG